MSREILARAAAMDPKFAAKLQAMQQGNQLSSAYAGVEDFLRNKESDRRQAFESTPSDVPVPMRAPEYQGLSPIEQWKERNSAMMASGNPFLQERAAKQMDKGFGSAKNLQTIVSGVEGDPRGRQNLILNPDGTTRPVGDPYTTQPQVQIGGSERSGYLTSEEKVQGGLDPESPFVWGKDGTPKPVKPSGYTQDQMNAAGFAERMNNAESTLIELEESGFDPTSLQQGIAEKLPIGGSYLATPEQQVHIRAQRDWVRAKLRKESGATIGDQEMASEIETYFPVPGDEPPVLKAKAYARKLAHDSMATASGGRYKKRMLEAEKAVKEAQKEQESSSPSGPAPGFTWDD